MKRSHEANRFCLTPDGLRQIRKLADAGKSEAQIISTMKIDSAEFLRRICHHHGVAISGKVPPAQPMKTGEARLPTSDYRLNAQRRSEQKNLVPIKTAVAFGAADTFAREATIRGTTADALASRLLEIVATDGLFTALLDN